MDESIIWITFSLIFIFLPIFAVLGYLKTRKEEKEGKEKGILGQAAGVSGLVLLFGSIWLSDFIIKHNVLTEIQLFIVLLFILGILVVLWYKN